MSRLGCGYLTAMVVTVMASSLAYADQAQKPVAGYSIRTEHPVTVQRMGQIPTGFHNPSTFKLQDVVRVEWKADPKAQVAPQIGLKYPGFFHLWYKDAGGKVKYAGASSNVVLSREINRATYAQPMTEHETIGELAERQHVLTEERVKPARTAITGVEKFEFVPTEE